MKGYTPIGPPHIKATRSAARFLYVLRFQVFILQKKIKEEAGSIPKAALEFNQKKSSLSHKGKALKSYYNAQSLHCFSAKLQHTVGYLNAKAN